MRREGEADGPPTLPYIVDGGAMHCGCSPDRDGRKTDLWRKLVPEFINTNIEAVDANTCAGHWACISVPAAVVGRREVVTSGFGRASRCAEGYWAVTNQERSRQYGWLPEHALIGKAESVT
jgi:hypothetical protein